MYYPPPEMEPRDPRKMSPLPRTPGHSFPKGCSVSNIGAIRSHEGACTLRPVRPFPGASPVFPLTTNPSPTLPSRLAKPAPSQPPPTTIPKSKPKPKPLPRPPPLEKRSTEPISMKYGTPAGGMSLRTTLVTMAIWRVLGAGGGGGYSSEFLVGLCGSVLQTLTLFQVP